MRRQTIILTVSLVCGALLIAGGAVAAYFWWAAADNSAAGSTGTQTTATHAVAPPAAVNTTTIQPTPGMTAHAPAANTTTGLQQTLSQNTTTQPKSSTGKSPDPTANTTPSQQVKLPTTTTTLEPKQTTTPSSVAITSAAFVNPSLSKEPLYLIRPDGTKEQVPSNVFGPVKGLDEGVDAALKSNTENVLQPKPPAALATSSSSTFWSYLSAPFKLVKSILGITYNTIRYVSATLPWPVTYTAIAIGGMYGLYRLEYTDVGWKFILAIPQYLRALKKKAQTAHDVAVVGMQTVREVTVLYSEGAEGLQRRMNEAAETLHEASDDILQGRVQVADAEESTKSLCHWATGGNCDDMFEDDTAPQGSTFAPPDAKPTATIPIVIESQPVPDALLPQPSTLPNDASSIFSGTASQAGNNSGTNQRPTSYYPEGWFDGAPDTNGESQAQPNINPGVIKDADSLTGLPSAFLNVTPTGDNKGDQQATVTHPLPNAPRNSDDEVDEPTCINKYNDRRPWIIKLLGIGDGRDPGDHVQRKMKEKYASQIVDTTAHAIECSELAAKMQASGGYDDARWKSVCSGVHFDAHISPLVKNLHHQEISLGELYKESVPQPLLYKLCMIRHNNRERCAVTFGYTVENAPE